MTPLAGLPAATTLASVALSLLPVVAFLAGLYALDSFKLLRWKTVGLCLLAGCVGAIGCMQLNAAIVAWAGAGRNVYSVFALPLLEEAVKAAFLAYLIRTNRVGFMVDSAICGFSIGTGFALLENVYYLRAIDSDNLLLWAVRGFGTAMMHGAATALVGILAMRGSGRQGSIGLRMLLPGLLTAAAIHVFYNYGFLSPLGSALVILIGLPILVTLIFIRSEEALRSWASEKLDQDIDLLGVLSAGEFMESNAGQYLKSLRGAFPPEIVGDMLCYLQLSLELSAQNKGALMRREMGLPAAADPELPARLKELAYLERSIGRAGIRAVAPLLPRSSRDLWELNALAEKHGASR